MVVVSSVHQSGSPYGTPQGSGRKVADLLAPLIDRPQWVAHRAKMPINVRTGTAAASNDPGTWSSYTEAVAMMRAGRADGIGFVLTAGTGLVCVDLDGCRNPETGEVAPEARAIVDALDSYTEISPSGTGLHIWIRATIPGDRNKTGNIEMYETGRYMTVTEDPLPGYNVPIRDAQAELGALYANLFPAKPEPPAAGRPTPPRTVEERDVIARIEREESGTGAALLRGDHSDYPSPSEALAGLASRCLFYGADESTTAAICQASGLFKPGTPEHERERKAIRAAAFVFAADNGERYDADRWQYTADRLIASRRQDVTANRQDATGDEPQTLEDLRAELERVRAERDALVAERDEYRDAFNAVLSIIRIESLDASTRLTALGVVLLGMEFQAKGHKQTKDGYRMYASWIGRYSGQKPQTVNRQLKRLQEADLIDRKVKNEMVSEEVELIDDDGVIERSEYVRNGKRNYIALPDNVIDIVPRLAGYEKPEDAPKRGGARVRVRECDKHPGAELTMQKHYYCEACHHEAQHGRAPMPEPLMISDPKRARRAELELEPESESPIKLESDYSTVDIGPIKLERDSDGPRQGAFSWTPPERPARPQKPSNLCIEDGCMNPLPPGSRYYCAEHDVSLPRGGVAS